jgi:hypothetical protein
MPVKAGLRRLLQLTCTVERCCILKWCGWTEQPKLKKAVLPDDNFKFAAMKKFPKSTNIVLLFIGIYMSVAEGVLLDCAA